MLIQKCFTIMLFAIAFTMFIWSFWPPEENAYRETLPVNVPIEITKVNSNITRITETKFATVKDKVGNPKEYISGHYYATYLDIWRQQHHEMLSTVIYKANLAAASTNAYSVVLKNQVAPSNDIHDYLSLARYFWPNPDTPDGLPYIRKDGYANPEILTVQDYTYLRKMMDDIQYLGFGYFFTRNDKYVEKALYRLNEWFLDPKTKMNPNLNYGSFLKGENFGRRTGILDFHPIYKITQVIPLMRSSPRWNYTIERGFKDWLTEYYEWLEASPLSVEEKEAKNNHGTFYDVQVLFILDYIGRVKEAESLAKKSIKDRVAFILPSGQQPHETNRQTSWFYSVFNLEALFLLAERVEHHGVASWSYIGRNGVNQSIQGAVDYLLPFALNGGKGWMFKNVDKFKVNGFVKILELSWAIWGEDRYLKAIEKLRPVAKAEQAKDSRNAAWEDNYLCVWSLMTNKMLWTCLQ